MHHVTSPRITPTFFCRRVFSHLKCESPTPRYPDVHNVSSEPLEKVGKCRKYKAIERLNTIEEKLFAQNLDKYYGWNTYVLNEVAYPEIVLPFVKYIAQTEFKEVNNTAFHDAQGLNLEESHEMLNRIRSYIQEELLFELKGKTKSINQSEVDQTSLSKSLIHQLNRSLLTYFSDCYPHFLECMVDYEPRMEAFWRVGGFYPSPEVYNERMEKEELSEEEQEKPVEHFFQYIGCPVSQVRSTVPFSLKEDAFPFTSDLSSSIPDWPYDPQLTFDISKQRRHLTNIPGFWPGDKNEFIFLSYNLLKSQRKKPTDFSGPSSGASHTQGILASFASLISQASYQGFTTFNELSYPLFNQTILTDGRVYAFYLYQLNIFNHSNFFVNNPRVNYCIALPPKALYQEIKGSEFLGWNDDVLSSLLSCYLGRRGGQGGMNLKPYLSSDETYIADIKDSERRSWLHSQFRHMYSLRPRHRLSYEIYDWERIYKVKFETRPIDTRMRPFELNEDPLEERKYYEHAHCYIPHASRSKKRHWTSWRAKMGKTYYPEV